MRPGVVALAVSRPSSCSAPRPPGPAVAAAGPDGGHRRRHPADHRRGPEDGLDSGHGHLVGPPAAGGGSRPAPRPPASGRRDSSRAPRASRARTRRRRACTGCRTPSASRRHRAGRRTPTAGCTGTPGGARTTTPAPTTAGPSRRAADCRAAESEHLITYGARYAHALVIGFNYERPVRGRGAGIFLHVERAWERRPGVSPFRRTRCGGSSRWAEPAKRPHIAVGTVSGTTAVTRY